MIAELLVRSGTKLVRMYPPEGRAYWAARFWDRTAAERHPLLGDEFREQKAAIADLLKRYGANARKVIEFACGTGEFTEMVARLTSAEEIVANDISEQALRLTSERVGDDRLRLVHGDFWKDHDLGTADLVVCIDAVHHIGEVGAVLRRLREFVAPGGVLVTNVWTVDHFHEFQRQRYGAVRHLGRCALFFGSAALIRATDGRVRTASYRTQLLTRREVTAVVEETFDEVLAVAPSRNFIAFACRA
ncbi:class I SAM-dependent methyltransferase [Actinoallomurus sp. NPDC052274]|uniref:class I SAM-dependent methyltransferase n=1 Tax=Actinoallomurus sp. NPDC052274 TaxID=3155420 RepID=UPI003415C5F8